MSQKFLVAALLVAASALTATPTLAATWHRKAEARDHVAWQSVSRNDPTQYLVENAIPVPAQHSPGIAASASPVSATTSAYAYAPAEAYHGTALGTDPTMYAVRNSIPVTPTHVPGFGARP